MTVVSSLSSPYTRLEILEAGKVLSTSGGHARAKSLPKKRRSEIASKAAATRWKNLQDSAYPEMIPGEVYAC